MSNDNQLTREAVLKKLEGYPSLQVWLEADPPTLTGDELLRLVS